MSATTPKTIARYQVVNHLGTGGMGSVFLARDPALGRLVAIKLLREGFDSPELRERFEREARSAGRLRHTNIVTVFDVGEHGNEPFIAMEYVEGQTLSRLISQGAPMSLGRKLRLMDELSAGLHYAHRSGIVHRDIKPENIMVDIEGTVKVLDFGIARINDAGAGSLKTKAGMLMGTLNYMAPEQMMGLPDVDARADIFSAGAVFYELLTSRQAFPGGLESGILNKIINVDPEPLAAFKPNIDPAIVEVVNRCLAKSRDTRYRDLGEVRKHLQPLIRRYTTEETVIGSQTMVAAFVAAEAETRVVAPKPDTRDLDRLRGEQIRTHLENARNALAAGNFTLALEASQSVLLLDAGHRDAHDLENQARAGLKAEQLAQFVTNARRELERGALTSASLLVDEALSLNSASPEAVEIRTLLNDARRQLAEAEDRRHKLEAALAAAQNAFTNGDLIAATAHVDDALEIDPASAAASALQAEIAAIVEQQRRAEEQARAARAQIADARRRFAAGDHAGAIAALELFKPPAAVAEALSELRVEFREIERLRIEAEVKEQERKKRLEAAEALRKATAQTLAAAAALLDKKDFDGARALTRKVLSEQPQHTEAAALEVRIEEQREKDRRDKELRAKEQRDKEQRDKEQRDKEQRDKEQRDREKREKEQREKEQREKEQRDREQRDREHRAKPAADATVFLPRGRVSTPVLEALAADVPTAVPPIRETPPIEAPRPEALTPRPRSSKMFVAVGAVVLAVVGFWLWSLTGGDPPRPVNAPGSGTVILDILPWATIESITLKAQGTVMQTDCSATPCVLSLPAGQYHVRAVNPNYPGTLEFDVTVESNGIREQRQSFPGFEPEGEVATILENKK